VDASYIEDGEGGGDGRYGTGVAVAMAELEDDAEVFERHTCKTQPSPTLKKKDGISRMKL